MGPGSTFQFSLPLLVLYLKIIVHGFTNEGIHRIHRPFLTPVFMPKNNWLTVSCHNGVASTHQKRCKGEGEKLLPRMQPKIIQQSDILSILGGHNKIF